MVCNIKFQPGGKGGFFKKAKEPVDQIMGHFYRVDDSYIQKLEQTQSVAEREKLDKSTKFYLNPDGRVNGIWTQQVVYKMGSKKE